MKQTERLASDGGHPVREIYLPGAQQDVDEDDIRAVVTVLRSKWLTTGPSVEGFEEAVAEFVGARHAVAVANGTAALHAALYALDVGPGDEVIVPPMTFVATANAVLFMGGTPVFADVSPDTLLLDPAQVEAKLTPNTKAVIAVDYAGQPCDYDALRHICERHGIALVADACHALGAQYKRRRVGTLADLTAFSFHPVKHITTGEGGMIVTNREDLATCMRRFRNHGITTDHRQRAAQRTWQYEMETLGYNYRLTDLQCALGIRQLQKLPRWLTRRQEIAELYDESFVRVAGVKPLRCLANRSHAYHLYVVQLDDSALEAGRATIFSALQAEGIGVNVHYMPVHLHPYYQQRFGYRRGEFPVAEEAYTRLLSLPLFPGMSNHDVADVVRAVHKVVTSYASSE
jgi:perosamine synthetase